MFSQVWLSGASAEGKGRLMGLGNEQNQDAELPEALTPA